MHYSGFAIRIIQSASLIHMNVYIMKYAVWTGMVFYESQTTQTYGQHVRTSLSLSLSRSQYRYL